MHLSILATLSDLVNQQVLFDQQVLGYQSDPVILAVLLPFGTSVTKCHLLLSDTDVDRPA